jgi:hypothetical protein
MGLDKMSDLFEFIQAQKRAGSNIETSVRCSLRCPQCQRVWLTWDKEHPRYKEIKGRISEGGDLSLENFKKIVNFAGTNEYSGRVNLCGQISDPIYWPYLKEAIQYMEGKKQRLTISTAGSHKNIEWYKDLFSVTPKNVTFVFGLDGIGKTSEIYRQGQNSSLIWEAMLLGKEMGLIVEWQFIVFEHNVHEFEDARALAAKHRLPFIAMATDRAFNGVQPPKEWKAARNKKEFRFNSFGLLIK